MKTEANRGEAPGTDSVPSASGGPADASGEELTALGSTASFSFQKQFPPPILLPPGPWPEVQQERGGWEHRSQAGRSHRGAEGSVAAHTRLQLRASCQDPAGTKDGSGSTAQSRGCVMLAPTSSLSMGIRKGRARAAPPPPPLSS